MYDTLIDYLVGSFPEFYIHKDFRGFSNIPLDIVIYKYIMLHKV